MPSTTGLTGAWVCVLGIDVSTTATKALLVDEAGTVRGVGIAEYGVSTPQPAVERAGPGDVVDGRRSRPSDRS